jgi:hypothetical protein
MVADTVPNAIYTPSAAHWIPAESPPSPVAGDFCSSLGPELEIIQHTKPDLYEMYLRRTEGLPSNNDQQQPFQSTKVSVNLAARNELGSGISEKGPRKHRIVCHAEKDPYTEYQGVTLLLLQIIVAIAIIACIAEGLHLSLSWVGNSNTGMSGGWKSGIVSMPGSEKRMFEVSSVGTYGSEKSELALDAAPMLIVHAPNGDRICITYEEDDDDEVYRPVM